MTRSNSPAPTIPLEVILPRIIQHVSAKETRVNWHWTTILSMRDFGRIRSTTSTYSDSIGYTGDWRQKPLPMLSTFSPKMSAKPWRKVRQFRKDAESTLDLKWTPNTTCLTELQRMPITILPSIEQSYFIIAAKLLEQRLHRGWSILFYSDINSSHRRG
jgi:hypothetical protein